MPNDGQWTESRFASFIKSALRSASQRWPPKFTALNNAKRGKRTNSSSGRIAEHYECAHCHNQFPAKEIQVNHKESVVPLEGFTSWDDIIKRLFCDITGLEVLCKPCHKSVTQKEREMRKSFKEKAEKDTYSAWQSMKQRCFNPNAMRYYTHGGRGITVCDRWRDSYDSFLEDMGLKPEGYSLERKDNDKNYEPGNCKWATPEEQANNRRTNIYITFNEETLTVQQWARALNISLSALMKRLEKWPLEKALSPERFDNQKIDCEIKQQAVSRYLNGESQAKLAKELKVSQAAISKWVKENEINEK